MDISIPNRRRPRPSDSQTSAESLIQNVIQNKHTEYVRASKAHRYLYYSVRLAAGLSAAIIPFVVRSDPTIATILSVIVVIATVTDSVFNPKDRWRVYSRASDLLAIEQLKSHEDYEKYASQLAVLSATENAKLEQLVNLDELIKKVKSSVGPQ